MLDSVTLITYNQHLTSSHPFSRMLRDFPPLGPRFSHDEALFMNGAPGSPDPQHEHQQEAQIAPLDDVFGSAPSSPTLAAQNPSDALGAQHHDLSRLRTVHTTSGYREGIAASKEKFIQEGFDEGYSLGGEIGLKVGWCLGALEGILFATRRVKSDDGRAMQEKVKDTLNAAQEELQLEKLFGSQYFADGVWLYDVPEADAEEGAQVTFGDIAAKHPVVKKWTDAVVALSSELGLALH